MQNVYGGVDSKKFIIETTGSGVAVIDYDNDGWPDLFFVNGTTLEKRTIRTSVTASTTTITTALSPTSRRKPTCGTRDGGKAACVGDYDNDGHDDLLRHLLRKERALPQQWRRHVSPTSARKPALQATARRGAQVVPLWIMTATANST